MIIGGLFEKIKSAEEIQKFQNSCMKIGGKLRECGHSLVLCSPFNDSADYWVFQGFVKNESKAECIVDFYFVDCDSVKKVLEFLEKSFQSVHINKILIPSPSSNTKNESMKYAWLLCQLQALEHSQGLIAIGGKENESADMLLRFGEQKRKSIYPFSFMGGAEMHSLYRKQYALMDRFGSKYPLLQDEIHFCDIFNELEDSMKSKLIQKRSYVSLLVIQEKILMRQTILIQYLGNEAWKSFTMNQILEQVMKYQTKSQKNCMHLMYSLLCIVLITHVVHGAMTS